MTADDVLDAYATGHRRFQFRNIDGADFEAVDLRGASFYRASLRAANLKSALLTHTQFKGADLRGACLSGAILNATDLIGANFEKADLRKADLTGAALNRANLRDADMRYTTLGNARFANAVLTNARFDRASLSSTNLTDVDIASLCNAIRINHEGPSSIDARTVIKSFHHPKLAQFMLDCGVPHIFVEYMIECARALEVPLLRSLMQSTFISYGGPDEAFARKLYEALRAQAVVAFFFPETATLGERIQSEVFQRLQEHDRVILVCSQASLDRPGVLNEIQETLDREARDGGAAYLIPVTLDDYVFSDWKTAQPQLAEIVGRRVVGDFRRAAHNKKEFDKALGRLLNALKAKHPTSSDTA